jgi:hypothetical protein
MLSGFFPYSSMSTNELPPRLIIVSSSSSASSSSSVCLSVLIIVFVVYYGWMSVSIECCKCYQCYQCYQCNLLLHFRPFRPCRPFRSIRDKVVRPHTSTTRCAVTHAQRPRRGAPWIACSGHRLEAHARRLRRAEGAAAVVGVVGVGLRELGRETKT